jgi:hypothetical protein
MLTIEPGAQAFCRTENEADTMLGSRSIIFAAAAAALIFAWGAVPCLAEEVAGVANQSATEDAKAKEPAVQEAVSKEVVSNDQEIVVATNAARNRVAPPADFFLMPAPLPEKPRARVTTSVVVQPPPRVVAESQPSRICFWCGRQPLLMLGVGY